MSETCNIFTIKWILNPSGFINFVQKYRQITKIPFGGTKKIRYTYPEIAQSKVLSVGQDDDIKSLPLRLPITNFTSTKPITSYGCILRIKKNNESIKYLTIRRTDSLSYVELIHGNYKESQLFFMLKQLTTIEIERILTYKYEQLWEDLNRCNASGIAYEYGKQKFEKLLKYLRELFDEFPTEDPDGKSMWLFPKGRPNYIDTTPECSLTCALREFTEETNGISLLENARPVLSHPVIERYMGSNSKNYATHYFIFEMTEYPEINQFEKINTPIRTVSTGEAEIISLMTIQELERNIHPGRFELIKYIEKKITNGENIYPNDIDIIWKSPVGMDEFIASE